MAEQRGAILIKEEMTRSMNRGFTLLEVLIAITIFAVGLLGVATMQISAIRGNRLGNEVTQATALAQLQIEALKSADTSLGLDIGLPIGTGYLDPNNPIDEEGENGGIFTRSWVITPNTTYSRRVAVTVAWGNTHDVILSTVTRGGGN